MSNTTIRFTHVDMTVVARHNNSLGRWEVFISGGYLPNGDEKMFVSTREQAITEALGLIDDYAVEMADEG